MTPKRAAITAAIALLCAVFTTAMAFAITPGSLAATGLVCPAGATFHADEGATFDLPDGQRAAPVSFVCVTPDGARAEASLGAALALVFALATLLWSAALGLAVRSLARAARGTRPT